MTTSLSSRQALLTKSVNRLNALVDEHRDLENWIPQPPSEGQERRAYAKMERLRFRKIKACLASEIDNVDKAIESYSSTADILDAETPSLDEILKKVSANLEKAATTVDKGRVMMTVLIRILEELDEMEQICNSQTITISSDVPQLKLAPIPIPKFSGRAWEWDAFWKAFEHSVHSREMDDMYKMSYLLDALQGEAKETIKQYEISGTTYPVVIARLREKYGNTQVLVDQLIRKLQGARALSTRLEHQQKLWEELSSIVSQLQLKGENVDNSFLQSQLLGKFADEVQRHVLRRKETQATQHDSWNTNTLLHHAGEYIRTELQIVNQMGRKHEQADRDSSTDKRIFRKGRRSTITSERQHTCFYCGKTNHVPRDCTEVVTREQRFTYMRKMNLCLNCGSKEHWAGQCKGGSCRVCKQRGHHTSLCHQLPSHQQKPITNHEIKKSPSVSRRGASKKTALRPVTSSKMNTVVSELDQPQKVDTDTTAFVNIHQSAPNVHILIGEAQVLNPRNHALEPVYVLLDTGADRSFICKELADRLQLQEIRSIELSISTFGSKQPLKQICGITQLQMWDKTGAPHKVMVTKIDTVTEPIARHNLSHEDRRFLFENNIQLSIAFDVADIRPQVLLGCADLYEFLEGGFAAQIKLPSGLTLIPSKLGYLLSGGGKSTEKVQDEAITNTAFEVDEGVQSWEDFCTFEASGVHEFTGSSKNEQKNLDAQVWERFERTIEKKEDGYYVRFLWREDAETLPDNKAIAVRRLEATFAKLSNDTTTLQQYNDTIQTQLEQGIIEEVDETRETTKLRIVFDASAHLKGHPSLNDVLYPGPVTLPKICDILYRFRVGNIAVVSDVEKAFLQIRVHPEDRDATRFLWLRNIFEPLTTANMVTYRFTRVTFGLNCSPFLLAGTIRHHLETCVTNSKLAKEIASNTYVDNVIVTTSSLEEAIQLYIESKEVFNELNMNLREFRSNNSIFNSQITSKDLSAKTIQKVLGVAWHTQDDQLHLTCQYRPVHDQLTKRYISEQVASIYDPVGLLTPLTLRGKQFLQRLWALGYKWDTPLKAEHQREWKQIIEDVNGFRITIPRKVAQIDAEATLAVFADASSNGMAACAYLVSDTGSHLLAGKSKLPSLKDRPTIPKLEMNALTMATRLAYSIYTAICQRVKLEQVNIFSDSEIALSWLKAPKLERSAGVLVNNQREEIRKIVDEISIPVLFGFVPSTENPADCGTRGLVKKEFNHHIWWHGPDVLNDAANWPKDLFALPLDSPGGETCTVAKTASSTTELLDWSRHNCLTSMKRTMAYVLRFIRRLSLNLSDTLRKRLESSIPELSHMSSETYLNAVDYEMALHVLIRHHQQTQFSAEHLKSLKQLNFQPDGVGILRCRGRLGNAHMAYDTKHPMLIASKTELSKAIVREAHLPYHCGIAQTMANIRQRFWIPKLRQLVKQVLRLCVPCQKFNNLPFKYPEMDDLPNRRVQRTRPFEHVGIDYFGPLSAKQGDCVTKVYGIIVTCTATRLLHLELVPEMSTEHLLLALRRFFARRGVPASITSDNGPSFLLGEQVLRDAIFPVIDDVSQSTAMTSKGIVWKKITPYAPWQGAFYERLIKSVKQSLYKVLKREIVSVETLETILIEVGGTVNSRPLTYQEERWEDTPLLRPIDFIQRDIIISYPFESISEDFDDAEYLPPDQVAQLRTKEQAKEALRTSHQLTERY